MSYRRGEQRVPAENEARGNTAYVWEPHHTLPHWKRSGYGNQLRYFAQCILANRPPFPSLWDGWRNLLVGQCILESCASRQVVNVPQEQG